jgi:hypothetical protein
MIKMKINFFLSLISLIALYETISAELDNKKEEKKLTYSDIINKDYVKYFQNTSFF